MYISFLSVQHSCWLGLWPSDKWTLHQLHPQMNPYQIDYDFLAESSAPSELSEWSLLTPSPKSQPLSVHPSRPQQPRIRSLFQVSDLAHSSMPASSPPSRRVEPLLHSSGLPCPTPSESSIGSLQYPDKQIPQGFPVPEFSQPRPGSLTMVSEDVDSTEAGSFSMSVARVPMPPKPARTSKTVEVSQSRRASDLTRVRRSGTCGLGFPYVCSRYPMSFNRYNRVLTLLNMPRGFWINMLLPLWWEICHVFYNLWNFVQPCMYLWTQCQRLEWLTCWWVALWPADRMGPDPNFQWPLRHCDGPTNNWVFSLWHACLAHWSHPLTNRRYQVTGGKASLFHCLSSCAGNAEFCNRQHLYKKL